MRKLTSLKKRLEKEEIQDPALTEAKKDLHSFKREDCGLSEEEIQSRKKFETLDEFVEDQVAKRHALE
jgi:hypothetical protein